MLKLNKYKLKDNKIVTKQKILLIADIHLCEKYNDKILTEIINKVKLIKPNFICLCGDIIDEYRFLEKKENEKNLLNFLNNLAQITTTIITLGSHDYFNLKKLKIKGSSNEAIEYWQQLILKNKNPNLIILHNQIFENENIRILGYTPSRDYYYANEDSNVLISEINNNFNLKYNDNKYNILMCHTPRRLNKNVLEKINISTKIDLILSGHMHDGLVFPILKKLPTSIGIASPQRTFFPKNARGKQKVFFNNHLINIIITGGVIKFSNTSPHIFQKFNFLYNNDIDLIEIDK